MVEQRMLYVLGINPVYLLEGIGIAHRILGS